MFVEIEGGRIIASCMLASCLGQEVIISLTVVWRKRIHPYSLLLLTNRLHLLFRASEGKAMAPMSTTVTQTPIFLKSIFTIKSYLKILILFYAGMTITACTTLSFIQLLHLDEVALFVLGKHHLCDALAIINNEVLL